MLLLTSMIEDRILLAPRIADYLNGHDALQLASTCLACRVVRLVPLTNNTLLSRRKFVSGHYNGDAEKWQNLPLVDSNVAPPGQQEPLQRSIHTVFLRATWRDQGWGNRKGMISVVAGLDGKAPRDFHPWSNTVVCGKEPAPQQEEAVRLEFRPHGVGPYSIWLRAGGGGGHSLTVENLEVMVLEFCTPNVFG